MKGMIDANEVPWSPQAKKRAGQISKQALERWVGGEGMDDLNCLQVM
jgi:hypothetical protein